MREIKFRGKTEKINSWWTYGNLVICDNGDYQIGSCRKYGDTYFRNEVYPETVGQYTGLHDKNKVPIYEGDIVKANIDKAIVKYSDEYSGFILEPIGDYYFDSSMLAHNLKIIEVIGNIWDNKELLEEG